MQKMKSGEGGFTLVEAIITLVVLSIAAVGVLSVFTVGMKGSADPLIVAQATQLAQGELDAVVGIKQASGFSVATLNVGQGQACKTAPVPANFSCTLDICYVPLGNLNDTSACTGAATAYKRVAVSVTNARMGSVTAVSLLTNY